MAKNGVNMMNKGLEYHRRHHVVFIFQSYNLIDYMTPLENVNLTSSVATMPILEKVKMTSAHLRFHIQI